MAQQPMASLIRLSDTELTPASAEQDVRGRELIDSRGEEIGEIDDLLIDDREKRVRFLLVKAGGFLGIGQRKFLLPVDAIGRIEEKKVHVNLTRDRLAGAPLYDPDLVDERSLSEIYDYYGFRPFWGAGYLYPSFPFFV